MYENPYIVLGTGRSGTSFVADVMHNDMGISMGKEFPSPNFTNPDGFWEDMDFYLNNITFIQGKIPYRKFVKNILRFVNERKKEGIPWGFKESRMSMFIGFYIIFFDDPKIIWSQRDRELTIKSLMRCYEFSREKAEQFYEGRTLMIDRALRNRDYLTVYFDESEKTREEIAIAIEEKWGKIA